MRNIRKRDNVDTSVGFAIAALCPFSSIDMQRLLEEEKKYNVKDL